VTEERVAVVSSRGVASRLCAEVGQDFHSVIERGDGVGWFLLFARAMRVHQWAKNVLLFVPFILAHRVAESIAVSQALTAFLAFSFTASGIYLLNDLLDLSSDRRHPRKRLRPMASGALSVPSALGASFVLFGLAFVGSWVLLSKAFVGILFGYVVTTLLYSFFLKRLPVVDVLMLAFFYVYRLVAGAVATNVVLTPWLLAFAAFLFVSLGRLKRVSELVLLQATNTKEARPHGRGYLLQDLSLLTGFGINAGFLSTLVLALYINSQEVVTLYRDPRLLWGVVIALLYWVMRLWLLASRGEVHDDPVLFAIRDWVSRGVALFALLCLVLAI
jgi:4-hydroxybenzoate polyprenyltransferase and related prenyltransferases